MTADDLDLPPRFRVERRLGQGGFGAVYLATDQQLQRRVAVKVLEVAVRGEARVRFRREARLTAQLDHPHLVQVLDCGEGAAGRPWIAYEYLEGGDLAAQVRAEVPAHQLARWGAQVAEALQVAHDVGVVHRDVKPENIFRRGEDVVLGDLGVAHAATEQLTRTGVVLGTPATMAPETLRGRPPSPAADQWGLAASLWMLATGRLVYGGAALPDVLEALRTGGWPVGPGPADPALAEVLARALHVDPARRFPSCRDLAAALVEVEAGQASGRPTPVEAPPAASRPREAPAVDQARATRVVEPVREASPPTPKVVDAAPSTGGWGRARGAAVLAALVVPLLAVGSLGPTPPADEAPPPTPAPTPPPPPDLATLRAAWVRAQRALLDELGVRGAAPDPTSAPGSSDAAPDTASAPGSSGAAPVTTSASDPSRAPALAPLPAAGDLSLRGADLEPRLGAWVRAHLDLVAGAPGGAPAEWTRRLAETVVAVSAATRRLVPTAATDALFRFPSEEDQRLVRELDQALEALALLCRRAARRDPTLELVLLRETDLRHRPDYLDWVESCLVPLAADRSNLAAWELRGETLGHLFMGSRFGRASCERQRAMLRAQVRDARGLAKEADPALRQAASRGICRVASMLWLLGVRSACPRGESWEAAGELLEEARGVAWYPAGPWDPFSWAFLRGEARRRLTPAVRNARVRRALEQIDRAGQAFAAGP